MSCKSCPSKQHCADAFTTASQYCNGGNPSTHELLEIAKRGGYDAKLDAKKGTVVFTPRKPTNADRIRAMTDEELADEILRWFNWLNAVEWDDNRILAWLKQEAQCTSE